MASQESLTPAESLKSGTVYPKTETFKKSRFGTWAQKGYMPLPGIGPFWALLSEKDIYKFILGMR